MGAFGAGLYSSDFALDLKSAVGAVARLPVSDGEIVRLLKSLEPGAAGNAADPDHTLFWLVIADQLAKRGVYEGEAVSRAKAIIEGGADLTNLKALGAGAADLKTRAAALAALKTRLDNPAPKARKTLAKPQDMVLSEGEVFIFPTSQGYSINPLYKSKELISGWGHAGPWTHDGWGAGVVVRAGRAFDYLAWYFILRLRETRAERPGLSDLMTAEPWEYGGAGNLSRPHMGRMEIEVVGTAEIDRGELTRRDPRLTERRMEGLGRACAAEDIGLGNRLIVRTGPDATLPMISSPALGALADLAPRRG